MYYNEDEWHYWTETDPKYAMGHLKKDLLRLRYGFEFETSEHRKAVKVAEKNQFATIRIPSGVKRFYVSFYADAG